MMLGVLFVPVLLIFCSFFSFSLSLFPSFFLLPRFFSLYDRLRNDTNQPCASHAYLIAAIHTAATKRIKQSQQ